MTDYTFTITPVSLDRLTQEITASAITIALDHCTYVGQTLTTTFKANLPTEDYTVLSSIVTSHTGLPLPADHNEVVVAEPVAIATTPPFAEPLYRTKFDATEEAVEVQPGETGDVDFYLTEERWIYGGEGMITNAMPGDWFEAMVMDNDSVIPEPYRATLCEDWPIVNKYTRRKWVMITGSISTFMVNTYPLIAKITPGLYMRVKYHATSEGSPRKIYANYFMTKKL